MPDTDDPSEEGVDRSENKLSNDMEIPISNFDTVSESGTNKPTELVQLEGSEVRKSIGMIADMANYFLDPYETFDDSKFVSAMTRLIESPEPTIKNDQFIFVNIEAADDNEPSFEVFSLTTDADSFDTTAKIPYLRPDSPNTVQEPEAALDNQSPEDVTGAESQIVEETAAEVVQEKINRQEYIAKIKAHLRNKDRLKSKNQNLQSKLLEYFRRKRVM
jgi:hypothetical protein